MHAHSTGMQSGDIASEAAVRVIGKACAGKGVGSRRII